jgi:xanthine dehydrogenase YagS FAD-binding subunit
LSDVAAHPAVREGYPLIAQAIDASASGQVRNMATVGGNLLQRTRCAYFRTEGLACNKRQPGSGCGARAGENRQHAIFGGSAACVATHPSDLAVALSALGAQVETQDPSGGRRLTLKQLYRLPGDAPWDDTMLAPGELITAVHVSGAERFAARSTYLKVRDRAAFEFAVVSVAAALEVEGGVIVEARLAAGGVAPRPWRLTASEAALKGRRPEPAAFAEAAALAIQGAQPPADARFKVELLRRAVVRALETLGGAA